MKKVLHAIDDVDRLYVSRKDAGSIDASILFLEDYIEKRRGRHQKQY